MVEIKEAREIGIEAIGGLYFLSILTLPARIEPVFQS
jgi:hypothetical protein